MTNKKVEPPRFIVELLEDFRSYTGGHDPFIYSYGESRPERLAYIHAPTLYPIVFFPANKNGDWNEAACAIRYLISLTKGLPRLCAVNEGQDEDIARNINFELYDLKEAIAGNTTRQEPEEGLLKTFTDLTQQPSNTEIPPDNNVYAALKLLRYQLENHPEAAQSLTIFREAMPEALETAEQLLRSIYDTNLDTPQGIAEAAKLILTALKLNPKHFYLEKIHFNPGVHENHDLDYFSDINKSRTNLASSFNSPYIQISFQLPFELPIEEGAYQCGEEKALFRHIPVSNPKASWKLGSIQSIETQMSPTGLYAHTQIDIYFPGELDESLDENINTPPSKKIHENIRTYPEPIKKATAFLNKLISILRAETGRCDIPEVIPAHFNRVTINCFEANGIRRKQIIGCYEVVKITDSPIKRGKVQDAIKPLTEIPFEKELLDSAKLHLLSYNARRAVIDFAGAFEAFLASKITPTLPDLSRNIKEQFLSFYCDESLPEKKHEIEIIKDMSLLKGKEDEPRAPSNHQIIKAYLRSGREPQLDSKKIKKIMKIFNYRNDAAHGRPIPNSVLDELIEAVSALEQLMTDFYTATQEPSIINNSIAPTEQAHQNDSSNAHSTIIVIDHLSIERG